MKRKEKIILVSLALFNASGEANISSVDIANELEISPGNLYYHFKGKEEIIEVLAERLRQQIELIVAGTREDEQTLNRQWPYLYYTVETFYQYRFLLRNINDMVFRYPQVGKQLTGILKLIRDRMTELFSTLGARGEVGFVAEQRNLIARLVKNIMLVIIYSESYQILNAQQLSDSEFVQDSTLQMLSLIAAYLSEDQVRDLHEVHQSYLREKIVRTLS